MDVHAVQQGGRWREWREVSGESGEWETVSGTEEVEQCTPDTHAYNNDCVRGPAIGVSHSATCAATLDDETAPDDRLLHRLRRLPLYLCFFFFQAEDGIRDWSVTGVQTCALPI